MPDHPDIDAIKAREVVWSCNACGPSPGNRGAWCSRGCGRDYNRMDRAVIVTEDERDALVAEVERLREALDTAEGFLASGLADQIHGLHRTQWAFVEQFLRSLHQSAGSKT